MKKILSFVLGLMTGSVVWAQATMEANAGVGTWTTSSDWTITSGSDSDGVPDADDIVVIPSGATMRVQGTTEACASVQITAGASNAILQINTTGQLTINGNLSVTDGASAATAKLDIQGSTAVVIVTGNSSQTATVTANNVIDLVGSGSTLRIAGTFSFPSSAATITSVSGATLEFNGTATQTIPAANSGSVFGKIKSSNTHSGGLLLNANLTASNLLGALEIASGAKMDDSGYDVAVAGNYTNAGTYLASGSLNIEGNYDNSGTFTSSGCNINLAGNWVNTGTYTYFAGDNVTFDGTSGSNTITGATSWYSLTLSHGGGGVNVASGVQSIFGILDINTGTLDPKTESIVLKSNSSGTAQMADIGTGTYAGTITMERYLNLSTQGYRELASPVGSVTLANWQDDGVIFAGFTGADFPNFWGGSNAWWYDETAAGGVAANGWTAATNITNTVTITKGYRVYMDVGTYTLSVNGAPNMDRQTYEVTNSGGTPSSDYQNGWWLIGNPYPCTVDWDALDLVADKDGIEDGIWIWNATAGNYGSYANGFGGGTNGVTNLIASTQSFWIHANAATGTLTINENDKVTTDKAFVKSTFNHENLRIKMSGEVNSYYDEAVIRATNEGSSNYNQNQDILKLYTAMHQTAPSLALVKQGTDLTFGAYKSLSSVQVPIKAFPGSQAHGLYHLDFSFENGFLDNACVILEDRETGDYTDIKAHPVYYFVTSQTDIQPRFTLHISTDFDSETKNVTCHGMNDGMVKINVGNEGQMFSLLDMSGNAVNAGYINNGQLVFNNLVPGEYAIQTTVNGNCGTNGLHINVLEPEPVVAAFDLSSDTLILGVNDTLHVSNFSTGAFKFEWDFGNGQTSEKYNPNDVIYTEEGIYQVVLIANNHQIGQCAEIASKNLVVRPQSNIGIAENDKNITVQLIGKELFVTSNVSCTGNIAVEMIDMNGKIVFNKLLNSVQEGRTSLGEPHQLAAGIYLMQVKYNGSVISFVKANY